ncbi:hypothetical protein JOF42_000801 [Microbacterium phyllosphaerae]|uniref:Uncharacterized protein n=1 Tax=Microbacterium phyllosphaerae TaxID=124798 RepID=A0ABS4WMQ0_9MICO|nr:hypothetical protein [Microbacterium phyllosphaerae]MBP2377306.1 hypothetical protein [Microbacterium phyllosphaerae]
MNTLQILGGAVIAASALAMLTACSSADESVTVLNVGGTRIAVSSDSNEGSDAQFVGRLIQDEHGCWGVETDDETYTIVWPAGTTLDEDGVRTASLPDVLALGETLEASGGEIIEGAFPNLEDACSTPVIQIWSVTGS